MEKRPLPPGFQSRKIQPVDLPNPASFRELRPAILGTPPSMKTRWFERKRVLTALGIAAFLHVSLGLAWWLTPPLRLKAGYAPDRWVQVVSLPKSDPKVAPTTERSQTNPSVIQDASEQKALPPATAAHRKRRHSQAAP